jgi:predicted outer membrane repeat protein
MNPAVKNLLTSYLFDAGRFADCFRRISMWCLVIQAIGTLITSAATIKVTKSGDDGSAGTLRQVLASAASGDTIDASGIIGTISLTNGELLVSNSITVIGPGPSRLTVGGSSAGDPIFMIQSTGIVSICDLTITHFSFPGVNPSYVGRGIYNDHSTLVISNCAVIGNSQGLGGGIYNDGYYGSTSLSIYSSIVSSNSADYGAGIYNDSRLSSNAVVVIYCSTLSGNKALDGNGGGILNAGTYGTGLGGQIYIQNSTLSGNAAAFSGGGIFNDGEQGSTYLLIQYSTFCGNSATYYGGAILNEGDTGGSAIVEIGNTILSAGVPSDTIDNVGDMAYNGAFVISLGYNLSTDTANGYLTGPEDQTNTNPLLGPLAQNGGLTETHALLPSSPAINFADPADFPATDQRGYIRPIGNSPDIGAYEYGSYQPPLLNIASVTNNQIKFSYTTTLSGRYLLQASTNLATWTGLTTNGPFVGGTNINQTINLSVYSKRFFRLHVQ